MLYGILLSLEPERSKATPKPHRGVLHRRPKHLPIPPCPFAPQMMQYVLRKAMHGTRGLGRPVRHGPLRLSPTGRARADTKQPPSEGPWGSCVRRRNPGIRRRAAGGTRVAARSSVPFTHSPMWSTVRPGESYHPVVYLPGRPLHLPARPSQPYEGGRWIPQLLTSALGMGRALLGRPEGWRGRETFRPPAWGKGCMGWELGNAGSSPQPPKFRHFLPFLSW